MSFVFPSLIVNGINYDSKVGFHFVSTDQFDTDNSSFQPEFDFIFPGTDEITPVDFKSILWNNSSVSGEARIYDTTNSQQICLVAFSNTAETITSFGAISNLPAEESVFQVQLKKTGGVALSDTHLKSLLIYY